MIWFLGRWVGVGMGLLSFQSQRDSQILGAGCRGDSDCLGLRGFRFRWKLMIYFIVGIYRDLGIVSIRGPLGI